MGDENDFVPPWQSAESHDIVEQSDRIVRCTKCDKMATDASKLEQTPCLPNEDRGGDR